MYLKKQKNLFLVDILKAAGEKSIIRIRSRIRIQIRNSVRIWIRTNMTRIHNTDKIIISTHLAVALR